MTSSTLTVDIHEQPAGPAAFAGDDGRRLVTIETIAAITAIADADAIEAATIRGWTVVVKKGEFVPGDQVLYMEIDSALPLADTRFEFLAPRGSKVLDRGEPTERLVHVLKTARLRGTYSQGLAMPLADFPEVIAAQAAAPSEEAVDVAKLLGIVKYEPPIPVELSGQIVGPFPSGLVPKTDAERVQNLTSEWGDLLAGQNWYATEKIDGTSVTYINDAGQLRVCSRNWELAPSDGTQWQLAERYQLADLLPEGWAVQAELYGEGVQKNPLRIKGQALAVFAVFADGQYLPRAQWPDAFAALAAPVYPDLQVPDTIGKAVAQVDGIKSLVSPDRYAEGVVWHTTGGSRVAVLGGRDCFKAISNKYLVRTGG